MSENNGFTLVELAVVLTVIGLIASMIFVSGGSLFQSGKTAKTISIINNLSEAVSQFRETYKALPGDMAITSEIPNVSSGCQAGNNDEIINSDESKCVVEHLFRAGLIKADGADDHNRKTISSPFNSEIRVIIINPKEFDETSGIKWYRYVPVVAVIPDLPCDVVKEIDRKIDDDKLDDGIARAPDCSGGESVPYMVIAL